MVLNPPPILRYAGFWWRFLAWLIDQFLLCFLYGIVLQYPVVGGLATFTLRWLYYALSESSRWQGTLGKRLCGLIVVNANTFDTITFARASGRYISRLLSIITLGIGFAMQLFTYRRQTLHDRVAETLVLKL